MTTRYNFAHPRIPNLLKLALKYTLMSYREQPRLQHVKKIEDKFFSVQAYFGREGDMDILVFKGSQELRDWTINVQAVPWYYQKRWSHMGFSRSHRAIWDDIYGHLDPKREILVTGHSLGGAEAELSAFRLNDHRSLTHLITFGKPNVFFMPGRTRLGHLTTQVSIVHGCDIVARIPRVCFGPDKGQDMLYLANNGMNYVNPPKRFRRKDFRTADTPGEHISDHMMGAYEPRLNKFIAEISKT